MDVDSSSTVAKVLTIGCTVFSLVGVVLNIIVLAVVQRIRSMHTVTNYLLANVALADLLTLIWPSNIRSLLGPNIANATGNFLCKFIDNFPLVTMSVSALTLATLAVERYQGLVKPFSSRLKLTKKSVLYVIFVVWIVALAFLTPFLLFTEFNKEKEKCQHSFTSTGGAVVVVIFTNVTVLIPCVTITFCYFRIIKGLYFSNEILDERAANEVALEEDARMKKKLVNTLVIVTTVFIACHAPYTVLLMMVITGTTTKGILWLTLFVMYCNSMLNPILYALRSANYREGIKRICRCRTRNEQRKENADRNESNV